LNDFERNLLEPNAPSINRRIDALKKFSDIGIKTTVFFGPVYPTIKIKNLPEIINVFIENGATEIMIDKLNLKPCIKENVESALKSKVTNYNENYDLLNMKIFEIAKEKNIKIVNAF
jgi:DNA repair photolyase